MLLKKQYIGIILVVAALSIGCCTGQDRGYGIVEAASDIGNLDTFIAAIQEADLVDDLNEEGILDFRDDNYFIFAPTDQAFNRLPSGTLDSLLDGEGDLNTLMEYHIVENDIWRIGNISNVATARTLMGEDVFIESEDGTYTINGASVLETRRYDHGIIYVIDRVLIPEEDIGVDLGEDGRALTSPAAVRAPRNITTNVTDEAPARIADVSILQATRAMGNLNTFSNALETTDMVDELNGRGFLGTGILAGGPYTVFAPTDQAFARLPEELLDNEGDLETLLRYHIVDGRVLLNRTNLGTTETLQGDSIDVDATGDVVTINDARIVNSRRYANGIVHAIDRVLIPDDPEIIDRYGLSERS